MRSRLKKKYQYFNHCELVAVKQKEYFEFEAVPIQLLSETFSVSKNLIFMTLSKAKLFFRKIQKIDGLPIKSVDSSRMMDTDGHKEMK